MVSRDDIDALRERHLRDRAERMWQSHHDDLTAKTPEEVLHLVEDLQIHQIELQLQNQELRETQRDLEDSRQQLRDLYDSAPVGYVTIDVNGVIVRANLTLATMLGRARRSLIGQHFHRYVHRTSYLDSYRAVGSDVASWSGELVLSKSDGTVFPVALEMVRVGGNVVLWRCAVTDITTRKAEEHALRETAALLDLAYDAIFVRDRVGRISYWNEGAARCYGWSSAEARGQVSHVLLQTQFPEPLEAVIECAIRTGHWEGELVHRCRDGRRILVESRWTIQRDEVGDGFRILEINKDITVRKKAEAALRESQQQLQSYIDQAGDAIYVLDAETGRILSANARATQMSGYSRDELLRLSAEDIECEHTPEAIRDFHQRTKTGVVEVEGLHRRKDGSTFPVDIRITSLEPAPRRVVLAIVRDITDRKRLEQERADEVRRKDEFLALLGHELRNPLAAIHTAVQVLARGTPPPQRARMEEIIGRQTATMRRLVDDLLELERITHGHIELHLEHLDLAQCLQAAVAAMQLTVAARRQELVLRLPAEPVQFMADGTRLDQIVGNLLTNASKYTAPGGRIELSGAREGSDVIIRCKDNGQGILVENQQTIFQPFARGRSTELGYGEASIGIGLALVKQLIELHGGTISVESGGAGRGSVFTVRLPLVTAPTMAAGDQERAIDVSRRALSVVIVEDNPNVGETLKAALEQAGHLVHLFADGPSALSAVAVLKADAFLIDIGLPGMDGYELASELKKLPNTKATSLIAISGMRQRVPVGIGDPFDHYFRKPIEVSALLDLLEEISFREVRPPT